VSHQVLVTSDQHHCSNRVCHERSTHWAKTYQDSHETEPRRDMELRDSSQDKTWIRWDSAKTERCVNMWLETPSLIALHYLYHTSRFILHVSQVFITLPQRSFSLEYLLSGWLKTLWTNVDTSLEERNMSPSAAHWV